MSAPTDSSSGVALGTAPSVSESTATVKTNPSSGGAKAALSRRKNGKHWHADRAPFRKAGAGLTSYEKRKAAREAAAAIKNTEREMKAEKKASREAWITGIKERRARKEERERFEKMEETMHRKRVERVKRREKKNKMLGK